MAEKQFGQDGIGPNLQYGKGGPRIKDNGGVFEMTNAADSALVITRGADPVGDNDYVTKRVFDQGGLGTLPVRGQIDGGAIPVSTIAGEVFIVTTTGGGYTVNELYRGDGSSNAWTLIPVAEGQQIVVTDDLVGGSIQFIGDHAYLWDADAVTWVDIGPANAAAELIKTAIYDLAFGDAAVNVIITPPAFSTVDSIRVRVDTIWDTAATLVIELNGSTVLMPAIEIDLTIGGLYISENFDDNATGLAIQTSYTQAAATAGAARIIVKYYRIA